MADAIDFLFIIIIIKSNSFKDKIGKMLYYKIYSLAMWKVFKSLLHSGKFKIEIKTENDDKRTYIRLVRFQGNTVCNESLVSRETARVQFIFKWHNGTEKMALLKRSAVDYTDL